MALLYELLVDDLDGSSDFVFVSPAGMPWHRANFRQRFWRPAWDGVNPDDPDADDHVPAIVPDLTFHEGRHTHSTWLVEAGVPEVARKARLGHKMRGIARIYEHVTPEMERQISEALEDRWNRSLTELSGPERDQLVDAVQTSGRRSTRL